MNFKELLLKARDGEKQCMAEMLQLYQPMLAKESVIGGVFDEDLYQELCITLMRCVRVFPG